jgi:hypothetical protein
LTTLNISNNSIGQLVAATVLPNGWKKTNHGNPDYRYEHTDGRHQESPPGGRPEGVTAVAHAIKDMGAISKFTFSGDDYSKSFTMETTVAVADFSGKSLGLSGAIMLSAFLPKCT